ncbi:MAG TPA: ATP-binding protein [Candidatus Merdivicinus excrementipullorum]|uniref:ATP-binding protein n=1 Tax=Candidatus Merdivicinus excrementipullorum TaxID=2840867 RepID=A0A9D1FMG4_9FIRM|nr:ATP-binding protein [Candidatus Merdivicinus excrementipullorum]
MTNASAAEAARKELENRRSKARVIQGQRVEEIARKVPQVIDVRKELSLTAVRLSKMILEHKTDIAQGIEELKRQNLALQQMEKELLRQNGYPEDYLELHYTCPYCQDTGFAGGEVCACFKQLEKQFRLRELNAGSNMELCDFSTFDLRYYPAEVDPALRTSPREQMGKVLDFCKHYAASFTTESRGLFFSGPTGLGKTHLSLAIAREVIGKGYGAAYGSAQNFLMAIEEERFGRERSRQTLDQLLEADLLVLDDLGTEFTSAFTLSTVYNLLNTRKKPTIISSNLTVKELQEKYSQRVVSRLFSQFTYLRFVGKDIRQLRSRNF